MFRLGMFDPLDGNIYASIPPEMVDRPEARALSLEAATKGSVLLKNDGILPLTPATKLAFVGPHINSTQDMLSAPQYHGQNVLVNSHSPLQVALRRGWTVTYERGCNICDARPNGYPNFPCQVRDADADRTNISKAVAIAKGADTVVCFLGNDQTTEAENFDRYSLALPGAQQDLLEAIAAVQSNVIIVLQNGGPIAVDWAVKSTKVRAILDAFQPGQLGGDAIMDLLSGASVPSGKLPYTMYTEAFAAARSVNVSSGGSCSVDNCGSRDPREMDLRVAGGVTAWWSTQPALYPFGWGLSYTTFDYKWSNVPPLLEVRVELDTFAASYDHGASVMGRSSERGAGNDLVMHTVNATNTGSKTADCIVLAFITAITGSATGTPLKKLFGFERLERLQPGESRTVNFASGPAELANTDELGALVLRGGRYGVEIGDVVQPAKRTIVLLGDATLLRFAPRGLENYFAGM
eukprot:SAG31_NODE_5161_length_2706_cov_2.869582_3_plen_465_part_00